MSCAACQARVEKAVQAVKGVESVSVSLLTNSMGVEGSASDAAIIRAVTEAGYGASVKDGKRNGKSKIYYESGKLNVEKFYIIYLIGEIYGKRH